MIRNPYWAAVKQHARPARGFFGREPDPNKLEIGGFDRDIPIAEQAEVWRVRETAVKRWSWTVTDPASVQFVYEHVNGDLPEAMSDVVGKSVLDPMAGTGYWAYLLGQLGVDCLAYDEYPPQESLTNNHWHPRAEQFVTVLPGDAVSVTTVRGTKDRTLLLAWPPYSDSIGYLTLDAFRGDRLIYIGELEGGCCADDKFFAELDQNWKQVDWHRPVQYFGIHDVISVYDRIREGSTS